MQQIGTTTVKRTTAKARRYVYPYIPLPPQYGSLVGSQVDVWQSEDNELTLRFGKSCHADDLDSNSDLGVLTLLRAGVLTNHPPSNHDF
jgi:hypothetical protein